MGDIGKRLAEFRRHFGYTQKEMSHILGIGYSTYQHYEQGKETPTIKAIYPLSDHLLDFHWLLTGKGPMIAGQREKEILPIDDICLIEVVTIIEEEYAALGMKPRVRRRAAVIASGYDVAMSTALRGEALRGFVRRQLRRELPLDIE